MPACVLLPAKAEVSFTQGTVATPPCFIFTWGKKDWFVASVGGAYLSLAGVSVTLNIADNTR
jgi:hypothetical protein